MVRLALSLSFVAGLIVATSALPSTSSFVRIPLAHKNDATHIKNIVASDLARYQTAAAAAIGSGSATNEIVSYYAPIKVGSQTFQLIVDTGSSNTWVGANTKFSAGSTGKSTGKSVSVSYGSGSFSGTEYTDTVSYAGFTVASQSIGVASRSTGFSGVDGIFGVGPVDLTSGTVSGTSSVPTFLDNLYSQGQISTEVLGVYFAPPSGSTPTNNGELTLGGTDSSKYTGSITYTPTLKSGSFAPYWGIGVSSITFGSTSLGSSLSAIVDTGTTLIYVPSSVVSKFASASGGTVDQTQGLIRYSTAPTSTLSFTIGGRAFTLTPSQYLIPTAQATALGLSSSYRWAWLTDGGSSGVNFIIGQKFLEQYYSVYDTTNGRVGFATRA